MKVTVRTGHPLTRNEFLQMAGRAGRKGFFNTGYVSYIPRSRCENFDYDTGILYLETLDKPCEEAKIKLLPAIGRLLKKEVTVETEAKTLSECSMPRRSLRSVTREVENSLREITQSRIMMHSIITIWEVRCICCQM